MTKAPDENDRRKNGTLPNDPFAGTTVVSASNGWDPLVPLDRPSTVPTFPTGVLPSWLGAFVAATAEATQTPPDLAGMLALAAISLGLAKKFKAEPRSGWREPVNIYGLVALEPANRKSAVFSLVLAPVQDFERESIELARPRILEARAKFELMREHAKKARGAATKGSADARTKLDDEALRATVDAEAIEVPPEPRVFVDDVTPEQLVRILHEQGGRVGAFSPEGGLFSIVAGRYTTKGEPNLDAILKAHAGDDIRVDRVGRPADFVRSPALVLGLAVQPSIVNGLARERDFRGRGLLARIFFSLPVSPVGRRKIATPPVPEDVAQSYANNLGAIFRSWADRDASGEIATRVLSFDGNAQETLMAFERDLEPRLHAEGDLADIQDWAGKLAGLVVRFATLLHVADHIGHTDPGPVSRSAVERAIEMGRYALAHAVETFSLMGVDEATDDARHVLGWIRRRKVSCFSARDAFEGVKGRLKRMAPLEKALEVLVERCYLRILQDERDGGRGRPPSPRYQVNPAAFTRKTETSAITANSATGEPGGVQ